MAIKTSLDIAEVVSQYYIDIINHYPTAFIVRNYVALILAEDRYTSTLTKIMQCPFVHQRVIASRLDFLKHIRNLGEK